IQRPAPLRTSTAKKDSSKYCRYHRDNGHDTEECRQLKNQIEDLIRKGHLRKCVGKDAPLGRREHREEAPQQREKQQPRGKKVVIGEKEDVISFLESDLEGVRLPHDDPVMVTLLVELFTMKGVFVDSGSSAEILYKLAFDQLRIPEGQLKQVKTPLVGFAGETIHPLGSIDLFVIAGSSFCQTVHMTFLVIDTPRPYKAIIGLPRLNAMEA
ncbi:LOW QUALITY PROTEIN: hypothetical protein CFOL_v3_10011, partial [Cephalotus follicularis]